MKFLGRSEKINLIDLQIDKLSCKIDTGAFGNAIHCDDIKIIDDKLSFRINDKNFLFEKYKTVIVKNSFGKKQKRFLIFTRIKLGNSIYKVYLSLTNRKDMRHPMLIGRRFLHKFDYLVNVKEKNTYDRAKKV
jgi:hypothetical protein